MKAFFIFFIITVIIIINFMSMIFFYFRIAITVRKIHLYPSLLQYYLLYKPHYGL